ncbi:CGNR zinc finger domain-containing protein [Kribbella solani]|uniref:Putative RNA-binding Zn ribbon-like protein n=1 Tax=Kribbella solani TaxID=236067 RepID=A0A841E3B4_9ACTN|nr:ABATE domain-containing protein [Kribbella solani]MBB5983536.1 putative RNA-binding Zn ribbon-like protein [Kribbella solani]MDX2973779.1 ABATE domain-containing protein [Kribbella solani]
MTTLALALATTIKHDGHGGVADLLSTPEQASAWFSTYEPLVRDVLGAAPVEPEFFQGDLLRVRRAVRALFARAVPGAPSKADANRLMDAGDALRMLNRAADRLGTTHLDWPADGPPVLRWSGRTDDPTALLIGAIARSAIDFLAGPDRDRLRACPAARCVKYFLQDDPRQTWCSPSCGNRERVNRHYRKRTT